MVEKLLPNVGGDTFNKGGLYQRICYFSFLCFLAYNEVCSRIHSHKGLFGTGLRLSQITVGLTLVMRKGG